MDWKELLGEQDENEKPLDHLIDGGGFSGIFRTIACIGDSLSSGEFESLNEKNERHFHDMFEYSWGQYIARTNGCTVYNFSRGGMTARDYVENFAEQKGYWDPEKACQAYIIALGVNDVTEAVRTENQTPIGDLSDIKEDYHDNAKTFAGYYDAIIRRIREFRPDAKFFLMTMPVSNHLEPRAAAEEKLTEIIRAIAEKDKNIYLLDFRKYAPEYDDEFKARFFMGGHMNPMGYALTAKMVMSYIDYIVRHNMNDFRKVGFIGTGLDNVSYKD